MTVSDVNQLVDRFTEAQKMMRRCPARWRYPPASAASPRRERSKAAKGKAGKKAKKSGRGPTPPKVKSPSGAGMPGMPAGFPDLSQMPEGLDESPPGWPTSICPS